MTGPEKPYPAQNKSPAVKKPIAKTHISNKCIHSFCANKSAEQKLFVALRLKDNRDRTDDLADANRTLCKQDT